MDRIDGRGSDQLRPVAFDLGIAPYAGGSVLVTMGNTRVDLQRHHRRDGATLDERAGSDQ